MEQKIAEAISETIEDLGFELVKVTMSGSERKIIEVMIDKAGDGSGKVNVGDCRKVSREISAILDVEDIVPGKYFLEVSSAGAERPLVRLSDYKKFVGRVAKIHLQQAIDDKLKYKGKILGLQDEKILFEITDGSGKKKVQKTIEMDFENIKKANLVFTEEMFKQIMKKSN